MTVKVDDGFFFGLGLFETIAVEKGIPIFLKEHLNRLTRSAGILGIVNTDIREGNLRIAAEQKLRECEWERSVLKINLTNSNLLLTVRENVYREEDYERGFELQISPVLRNETSPLTYHKTMNYGDNILEKRRAHAEKFDEPVFLNSRGELTEGASTNLFLVKGGMLYTPPVSSGLMAGIMRRYVMQEYPVAETVLTPGDAAEADEMFVTNSLLGVMPVRSFEGKTFEGRMYAERIRKIYRTRVESLKI